MSLVVIEGLDGAGKSTQIELLSGYLEQRGGTTHYLHFPRLDAPFFGELIARFLRGELGKIDSVDPYLVAMLYAADRRDAADTIAQWLNSGHTVLLDRYVYSNVAFQGAKLNDTSEYARLRDWIVRLEYEHFSIPKPDLNIFLDVPFEFTRMRLTQPRQGSDRNYLEGKKDIHEQNLDFQRRVREVYLKQQELDSDFVVISCAGPDGSMQSPDRIFRTIVGLLEDRALLPDVTG